MYFISLGISIDMYKRFSKFILKLFGWKFQENVSVVKKAVILTAPHTSSWDFVWGKLYFGAIGISPKIIIKKDFFIFPLGFFLKLMGGIPLDRKNQKSKLFVEILEYFKNKNELLLIITPEGTRKKRKKWKRGFYEIAVKAKVPIYIGKLDYGRKEITAGELFFPSGDYEKDLKEIQLQYKNVSGKHPDQFATEY